jgi:hypothetical protein
MNTDTKDDLVTAEMIESAMRAINARLDEFRDERLLSVEIAVEIALRAVAPMIAARAFEQCRHIPGLEGKFAWRVGAREEREACAKLAKQWMESQAFWPSHAEALAAAIRARGETP